ncbi:TetR family transcriptional regulator [Sphingomonas sp. Leaf24]|uniref:TetR/AcrR family transcriptional regulator n=1 Tax=unclassified Sphingomonas TaxID=196159 RepID=UPI0006F6ADE7|nr:MULTISPECIES: TetR/AcrR family transcriptional regulator [unclassified Sphingomonas]KQM13130.1 TetR family transcriptional regulator [Sphingomonas sp. Leaf5]KQM85716.1 TetR family transcriptional regulator [Sphingomonas sp. Leaf24]KQM95219.1 TetR family transcriptional regulator [Sphingomonas sp. Leaf22]
MGRRSDHSRAEIERMLLVEGHRHLAEVGFARFSAREVAKRIGYSIGTLYNVFGSYDRFVVALNTRTFGLWARDLEAMLAASGGDRIRCLVESYFAFARTNRNLWLAIYDHHLPGDFVLPDEDHRQRGELTRIVIREIAAVLPAEKAPEVPHLARSLVATVHGHCMFDLTGSFALMGEAEPVEMALARVRETLAVASGEGRLG